MPCVEERTRLTIKNILLAAVSCEPSQAILAYAGSLARHYGSKVSFITTVSSSAIYEIVRDGQIDLVVLGTQAQKPRTSTLDPVLEEVLRNVPCPILIIGPRVTETELAKRSLNQIVYVTDYTTDSLGGLPYALALAQDYNAQLEFVHVADRPTMGPFHFGNSRTTAFRKRLESIVGSGMDVLQKLEFSVQEGDRVEALVRIAASLHASVIVLNTRQSEDPVPPYALWPIIVQVLQLALCPVLLLRDPTSDHLRRRAQRRD